MDYLSYDGHFLAKGDFLKNSLVTEDHLLNEPVDSKLIFPRAQLDQAIG